MAAKCSGCSVTERYSEHLLRVRFAGRENRFYVFGGRDESAAALIQGITFAGILMDEVVLMPRSFVEQACARCSVAGSRLWFNCNPEGPQHWFYREWIQGARRRELPASAFYDGGQSRRCRRRSAGATRRLYSGVFYRRFVLGTVDGGGGPRLRLLRHERRRRLCRRGQFGAVVHFLRLRDGESGVIRALGPERRRVVPDERSFTSTRGARGGR